MNNFPKFVHISEEGPREGFQIEKGPIPTEDKIRLIDSLSKTGLEHIQICSFVNPKRVPGMADAEEVYMKGSALVMNKRGYDRAKKLGVDKVNIVFSPCEEFNILP